MSTHVLVTADTDMRGLRNDPEFLGADGSIRIITHYRGCWYSSEDPRGQLESITGTREEVLDWAYSRGADDVTIQEPAWSTPKSWRRPAAARTD